MDKGLSAAAAVPPPSGTHPPIPRERRGGFARQASVAVAGLSLLLGGWRSLAAQDVRRDRPSPTAFSCRVLTADHINNHASLTAALRSGINGVQLLYSGGQAGSGPRIRIRGNSSIHGRLEPLVFVDGVRITDDIPGESSTGTRAAQALDMINPLDVFAIVVFSGPAGTALYGTDAAGGVIHVYMKRGGVDLALEEEGVIARCGR
jgi:outer membrane cobalamin receptor